MPLPSGAPIGGTTWLGRAPVPLSPAAQQFINSGGNPGVIPARLTPAALNFMDNPTPSTGGVPPGFAPVGGGGGGGSMSWGSSDKWVADHPRKKIGRANNFGAAEDPMTAFLDRNPDLDPANNAANGGRGVGVTPVPGNGLQQGAGMKPPAQPVVPDPGDEGLWSGSDDVQPGDRFRAGDPPPWLMGADVNAMAPRALTFEMFVPKDGSPPQPLGLDGEQSYVAQKAGSVQPNPSTVATAQTAAASPNGAPAPSAVAMRFMDSLPPLPPDLIRTPTGQLTLRPDNPYLNKAGNPTFSERGDVYQKDTPSTLPPAPAPEILRQFMPPSPGFQAPQGRTPAEMNAILDRFRDPKGVDAKARAQALGQTYLSEHNPDYIPPGTPPGIASTWVAQHQAAGRTNAGRTALMNAFINEQGAAITGHNQLARDQFKSDLIDKRNGAQFRRERDGKIDDQNFVQSKGLKLSKATIGGQTFETPQKDLSPEEIAQALQEGHELTRHPNGGWTTKIKPGPKELSPQEIAQAVQDGHELTRHPNGGWTVKIKPSTEPGFVDTGDGTGYYTDAKGARIPPDQLLKQEQSPGPWLPGQGKVLKHAVPQQKAPPVPMYHFIPAVKDIVNGKTQVVQEAQVFDSRTGLLQPASQVPAAVQQQAKTNGPPPSGGGTAKPSTGSWGQWLDQKINTAK